MSDTDASTEEYIVSNQLDEEEADKFRGLTSIFGFLFGGRPPGDNSNLDGTCAIVLTKSKKKGLKRRKKNNKNN